MTETIVIPTHEGEFTPEEATALQRANVSTSNYADNVDIAQKGLKTVTGIVQEWTERLGPMHRRWRFIWQMLAGNSPERNGPEDVHVPELYKALETLIPRLEEAILEKDPWFRIVGRRDILQREADTNAALYDWQFDQANIKGLIQPAIRDALVTQNAIFYTFWDNEVTEDNEREVVREWDKDGILRKSIKVGPRKKVITFSGPRTRLVDPIDFIVDTKSTDPQRALYIGHRAWLTVHEIKRLAPVMGWKNVEKLDETTSNTTLGPELDFYSWPRDPTARTRTQLDQQRNKDNGQPEKLEVVVIYALWSPDEQNPKYVDTRFVVAGGRVVLEVRENPHKKKLRPYACIRTNKNGHEWYGTGIFDNAVRLNQHLDRYHQIFLRAADVAASPMVFAEEDSDMPDSLYKVRPFSVFKGVGPVRFVTPPDGFLRAGPLVIGMLQKNIEEILGAFRLNMGQDTGGTATEATLSLQEGNRRTRGLIRAIGEGLEQLLVIYHKLNLQFGSEDVEFPVLGKRALDIRRSYAKVSPADLLDDVKFDLIGLHSLRTNGLRATGFQAWSTAMAPFIMANPANVDQLAIMHDSAAEWIGPDEATRYVKIPTPVEKLRSQSEENEGLITGTEIEVDPDDDDAAHLQDPTFQALWRAAMDKKSKMQWGVRRVILQHGLDHRTGYKRKMAQQKVMDERAASQQRALPPEAGGQASPETGRSSPRAGGMSNAMMDLANEPTPGQTMGENPGPADSRKYPRAGGSRRTTNQTENVASAAR